MYMVTILKLEPLTAYGFGTNEMSTVFVDLKLISYCLIFFR